MHFVNHFCYPVEESVFPPKTFSVRILFPVLAKALSAQDVEMQGALLEHGIEKGKSSPEVVTGNKRQVFGESTNGSFPQEGPMS